MSYYGDNGQWSTPGQNTWEHQTSPARSGRPSRGSAEPRDNPIDVLGPIAGANGPTSQDDYAFYYQFEGT